MFVQSLLLFVRFVCSFLVDVITEKMIKNVIKYRYDVNYFNLKHLNLCSQLKVPVSQWLWYVVELKASCYLDIFHSFLPSEYHFYKKFKGALKMFPKKGLESVLIILLHAVDQFPQHHLLKRLSFLNCIFLPPLPKKWCP